MAKTMAVADEQSTGISRFRSQPEKLMAFLHDVRTEMRKVVSPTREEVITTTGIVIVTVFLFAAFFFLTDYVFNHVVTGLIQHLTQR
jgi:preprotein translocase subunit SecE